MTRTRIEFSAKWLSRKQPEYPISIKCSVGTGSVKREDNRVEKQGLKKSIQPTLL